jgi:hypothetical protein
MSMDDKMTREEATRAVIAAARAVLVAHEAAYQAGHGVGTALYHRIALRVALNDLDKTED